MGAVNGLLLGQELGNLIFLELAAQFLDLPFQFLLAIQELFDLLNSVVSAAAKQVANFFEPLLVTPYKVQGPLTRKSFHPSDSGSDTALERKFEDADLSRAMNVRAAA